MIKIIVILTILIFIFEGMPLIKQKKRNELIVFGVLIGLALLIGIGKPLGLPTPIELLNQWLSPIGKAIFKEI